MSKTTIYSVIIVEDEEPALAYITDLVRLRPDLMLKGIARNGPEAMNLLARDSFDILFLDVDIPIFSGLNVLEKLSRLPYIIFTTAFSEHAVCAFDYGAVDYLLKPFSRQRFIKAVDRAITVISKDRDNYQKGHVCLACRCREALQIFPYNEIYYLTSKLRETIIYTEKYHYICMDNFSTIQLKLPENLFIRVHRKYIVNVLHVNQIRNISSGQYMIILNDPDMTPIPIGRTFLKELQERFSF